MNVLNPFNNPDLAREILSYEPSYLPRLASVSQTMNMVSQERMDTYIRWMDKTFPLWYLNADIIRDQGYNIINAGGQAYGIVLYQMQRAAINKQWDALRVMANYHADNWSHLLDAIMIAHVNNNIPLAKSMFHEYKDRFPPLDQFPYSIIHFYTLQEDPSTLPMIKSIFIEAMDDGSITLDTAVLTMRDLVVVSRDRFGLTFRSGGSTYDDYIPLLMTRQISSCEDEAQQVIANSLQWNPNNAANVFGDVSTPNDSYYGNELVQTMLRLKYHNAASLARLTELINVGNDSYIESLIVLKSLGKKMGIDYVKRMVAESAPFYRIVSNDLQGIPITLESVFGDRENEDV